MNLFETEDFLKLLLSMLMGGLVGAEREYRSKSAGLRTTILISVGSTLFTMVSQQFSAGDRIAANIVNGIGFLGAGIIYRQDNNVRGLTTAATIWAVAALGMSIGRGLYSIAWASFGVMMITLLLLPALTDRINRFNQTRQYRITTRFRNKTLSDYENIFKAFGLRAHRQVQQRIGEEIVGTWKVVGSEKAHEECIQRLLNDNEVKEFEF